MKIKDYFNKMFKLIVFIACYIDVPNYNTALFLIILKLCVILQNIKIDIHNRDTLHQMIGLKYKTCLYPARH